MIEYVINSLAWSGVGFAAGLFVGRWRRLEIKVDHIDNCVTEEKRHHDE